MGSSPIVNYPYIQNRATYDKYTIYLTIALVLGDGSDILSYQSNQLK